MDIGKFYAMSILVLANKECWFYINKNTKQKKDEKMQENKFVWGPEYFRDIYEKGIKSSKIISATAPIDPPKYPSEIFFHEDPPFSVFHTPPPVAPI